MQDLSNLQVGDRVAIYASEYSKQWYMVKTVTAITKTGRIKVGDYEFNNDGSQRGKQSMSMYLELRLLTPEIEKAVYVQLAKKKISGIDVKTLDDDQAIALYKLCKELGI